MYVPKLYAVNDPKEVYAFLKAHPFGTVVTHDGQKPIATHVPLRFHEEDGRTWFTTHIAKNNPQWQTIEDKTVLLIVQGPDAYVSASWYGHEDVSTGRPCVWAGDHLECGRTRGRSGRTASRP